MSESMASKHNWPRGFPELLAVEFEHLRYPFALGTDCTDAILDSLWSLGADRYIFITDSTVASLYGEQLVNRLGRDARVSLLISDGGEAGKRLSEVDKLIEQAQRSGATRASAIVALGGGVVGNVAGMVAALMFRGIRLVHIPTTLMALLDSVISLKQAVNTSFGKNQVGTYYKPDGILGDTRFLDTLPPQHVRSGLCEVIKNALAIEPRSIPFLIEHLSPSSPITHEVWRELVRMGLRAKLRVMRNDRHERYAGLVLEYGHTVGHAIELEAETLSHGESVGLGMLVAAEVASICCGLSAEDSNIHHTLLSLIGAPMALPPAVCINAIGERLLRDNKRGILPVGDRQIPMVLLEALGKPRHNDDLPLHCVDIIDISHAMMSIMSNTGPGKVDAAQTKCPPTLPKFTRIWEQ